MDRDTTHPTQRWSKLSEAQRKIAVAIALMLTSCSYQISTPTRADLREHKPKFKLAPKEVRATVIGGFIGASWGATKHKQP